jgi:methyl-accepting chemotaxis protein
MGATLQATQESEQVVRNLRRQADEIGSILTVIDDVTAETSLLALNASIIASQAGEHGKAFEVVAGQMKALSDRVQASTQEISQVVRSVQGQAGEAAESSARGSASAQNGAELIRQVETALTNIARAAQESGHRMVESARSTAAQLATAEAVAKQMEAVREGVERIRTATNEQAEANIVVQQSSDVLNQSAAAVEGTVEAQTGGTSKIGESVEAIQRTVRDVTRGLQEQAAASRQVAEVVEHSRQYTRSHEDSAAAMQGAAGELARQAEALREAVRRFRI